MKLGDKIGTALVFLTIGSIMVVKAYIAVSRWHDCRVFHGLFYCLFLN